jgi:hypothetical protein
VRSTMQVALDALLASGLETGAALRVLRQLVMERLVMLDCDGACETEAPTLVASRAFGVALPLSSGNGAELARGGPALRSASDARSSTDSLSGTGCWGWAGWLSLMDEVILSSGQRP